MKKSLLITLICSLLFCITLFVVLKLNYLSTYNCDDIKLNNDNIFKETINVTSNNDVNYEEYNYKSLYFKNDFKEYKLDETINDEVYLFDENSHTSISLKHQKQFINMLVGVLEDDKTFYDEYKKDFLDKNNIYNDIDMVNYIKDHYYLKSNIFTSSKEIKINYIVNLIAMDLFSNGEKSDMSNTKLLEGNLKGFIVTKKWSSDDKTKNYSLKKIYLIDGYDEYIIELFGDNLTDDNYVNEFLKTIRIG